MCSFIAKRGEEIWGKFWLWNKLALVMCIIIVYWFRYFSHDGLREFSPLPLSSKMFIIFLKVKNKGMLDSPFSNRSISFHVLLCLVSCDSPRFQIVHLYLLSNVYFTTFLLRCHLQTFWIAPQRHTISLFENKRPFLPGLKIISGGAESVWGLEIHSCIKKTSYERRWICHLTSDW